MRIDRAGAPFILSAVVPALALLVARRPRLATPFIALSAFFAFFFRDPARTPPVGRSLVAAPADGRVLHAGAADRESAPAGEWKQISIFLSPLDVHMNRAPIAGRVERIDYQPGRFLPAYRDEAASQNERNEIWLIDDDGRRVVCRQVVGVLARRIVCRVAPGDRLGLGERFGLMKFGSRIDLFVPPSSTIRVAPGDRVSAGETVVALLADAASGASPEGTRG
jgi:phosphatidylserine decarboxylase